MSVDREDATLGGVERRVRDLDLTRVETALRVVVALLLLTIAGMGLDLQASVALWIVPVAWVLLAFDPPRNARED